MSCNERACKTNDPNSFIYCPKCLVINFPRLNVEDIFEMYVKIVEAIEVLEGAKEEDDVFQVLSPGELKEEAFDLYNRLILLKQSKEENDD